MRELPQLPVFPTLGPVVSLDSWRLRVDGLVHHPLTIGYAEVRALPAVQDTSPFACVEGWRVSRNQWRGVLVGTLLDTARPLPQARFVTVHSGEFIMSLALEEARRPGVLLAYDLNGVPLPVEHGGPLRLVVPGRECFYSVKWVERLELAEESTETGRAIALGRIQRRTPTASIHDDEPQDAGDEEEPLRISESMPQFCVSKNMASSSASASNHPPATPISNAWRRPFG